MFTMIVVDDERLNRQELRLLTAACGLPVQIIGEAANGEEALQLMARLSPDIVVTDVRMPRMDGLRMIEEAQRQGLNPVFVIVSGFAEFEYAQTAIHLSVSRYLLKPLSETEVNTVLSDICVLLQHKKTNESNVRRLNNENRDWQLYADLTRLLLFHETTAEGPLATYLSTGHFTTAVFAQYHAGQPTDGGLHSRLSKYMTDSIKVFVSCLRKNESIILLKDTSPAASGRNAVILAERILEDCLSTGMNVYVGISKIQGTVESLTTAYGQCMDALLYRFCDGSHRLFRYRDTVITQAVLDERERLFSLIESLFQGLYRSEDSRFLDDCLRLMCEICQLEFENRTGYENVRLMLSRLFSMIMLLCKNRNAEDYYKTFYMDFSTGEMVNRLASFEDFRQYVRELVTAVFLQSGSFNDATSAIYRIREWIDMHYQQEMQLEDFAVMFHMDAKYLSKLFKKNVGRSFIEYLTGLRIRKAKELLMNTDISANKIATLVGYSDVPYFHRVFKNKIGLTPMEFRDAFGQRLPLTDTDNKIYRF